MTFKRRGRWWVLVLLLVAVAVSVLLWHRGLDAGESRAASTQAAPVKGGLLSRVGEPGGVSSGAERLVAEMSGRLGDVEPGQRVDVCGVGSVDPQEIRRWHPAIEGAVPPWLQPLELRKDAVLSGLAARLAAGSDAEQVAARLLMNDAEGAALIASRSNDPVAYRLALARCGGPASPTEPHCSALSAQGWAQMDPEDARPWMVEAAEAVMRHDDAAAGRALEQVLQRSKRSPSSPLIATVVRAAGQVSDEAGLGLAMVQVIGMDAALPIRELLFSRYCRPEAVREGARRNSCERWARWQFEHADSVIDAMMAISTADRVGLPAAERPYTREQLDRGMRRLVDDSETLVAYDCRSLRLLGRWAVKRVEQGELKQALEAAGY